MYKKTIIAIGLCLTMSGATDTLVIPMDEAVQVNTKLINLLFEENKLLKEEINQIKQKLGDSKYSNTPLVKNAPYNSYNIKENSILSDTRNKMVMSNTNIRNFPKINSNSVIGTQEKGTIVQCVEFENNWCKTNLGGYIWGDNLKDVTPVQVITKKSTNIRVTPVISQGNIVQTIDEGIILNAVSYSKGWYKLEDNSYVSDKNVAKYCK